MLPPRKASAMRQEIAIGQITKLLCSRTEAYLEIQHYANDYDNKFDFYVVSPLPSFEIVSVQHLMDFKPMEAYPCGEKRILTISLPRHYLE